MRGKLPTIIVGALPKPSELSSDSPHDLMDTRKDPELGTKEFCKCGWQSPWCHSEEALDAHWNRHIDESESV